MKQHAIPAQVFSELSQGRGGAVAGNVLTRAERSKHLLLIRGVVEAATAADHKQAAAARTAYCELAGIQRQAPNAVRDVISQPSVGAWAISTIRDIQGKNNARSFPEQLSALVAGSAIKAHYPSVTRVPVIDRTIIVPSVGCVSLPESCKEDWAIVHVTRETTKVIAGQTQVQIPSDAANDTDYWHGLRTITAVYGKARLSLIIDDVDPFRFPVSADLGRRLNSEEIKSWESALQDAWDQLARFHQKTAVELSSIVTTLTPLHRNLAWQSNATSRTTFGCVALSPPSDGRTLALALAHELQHAKLAALSDLVTLTRPDAHQLFYAPWRDDPRPAAAFLQGIYAHLGVANFWRRQRHIDGSDECLLSHQEYVRWRDAVAETTDTLRKSKELTELGRIFVGGIQRTLHSWRLDRVPPVAGELA